MVLVHDVPNDVAESDPSAYSAIGPDLEPYEAMEWGEVAPSAVRCMKLLPTSNGGGDVSSSLLEWATANEKALGEKARKGEQQLSCEDNKNADGTLNAYGCASVKIAFTVYAESWQLHQQVDEVWIRVQQEG